MRLTFALFKKRNVTPGAIWSGKHRLRHKVFPWNIAGVAKRLQLEEQNMFYLRHPYLTVEQEQGYAKDLEKHETWMHNKQLEHAAFKIKPSVRTEDRLGQLLHTHNWGD